MLEKFDWGEDAEKLPLFFVHSLRPTYKQTQKKRKDKSFRPFGDPPGARTQDPSIKSAVLYQLS